MASVQQPKEFTQEEQGRYDRQIRLWGLDAQQRYVLTLPRAVFVLR